MVGKTSLDFKKYRHRSLSRQTLWMSNLPMWWIIDSGKSKSTLVNNFWYESSQLAL